VTVLIAYDGSSHADAAVDRAASLFPEAQAVVATAWSSARPAASAARIALAEGVIDEAVDNLDHAAEAEARQTAEAGASRAEAAGMRVAAIAVLADPSESAGILATAKENDAAVIVVGSRGRSAISSAVLGSVSNAVVQNSRRPVLVVPG
jgi:nucleotide-binding universal stress UspA family protein